MTTAAPSMLQTVESIAILAVPVIIAITLHEAAHGYVARHFGDDTAERAGRISLNPLRHVDLFGTIIIPGMLFLIHAPFLFGYAKPVPVNFSRLNHPKRDMIWVAAAGPGMNILLATISVLLMYLPAVAGFPPPPVLIELLWASLQINLVLAIFNLIPIPPLDGGRVAVGLLPMSLARPYNELSRFGIFLVLGILLILPRMGIDVFHWLVEVPVQAIESPLIRLLNPVLH